VSGTELLRIASIVEGHGEVYALPELLRRIAREVYGLEVATPTPHRVARSSMTSGSGLARAVQLQDRRVGGRGAVLVLADSDDDDPRALVGELQSIADSAAQGTAIAVVAVREYEAWFLAGIESLRSLRYVKDDASYLGDPEARRGCKEALERVMTERYDPIRHQPAMSSRLSIGAAAERAPSFAALVEVVGRIVGTL
jgi:hypothetical protein